MAMVITEVMGISANIMGNFALIPQIIKSFRTKQVDDLSMGMFLTLFITDLLWIGYGLPIEAKHLWTSSAIEIGLLLPIFGMWLRYRHKARRQMKHASPT